MPIPVLDARPLPRVPVRIRVRRRRREAVRDELPHDPADLVEVRPPVVVARRGLFVEVVEADAGLVVPFARELLGREVVDFAGGPGAPERVLVVAEGVVDALGEARVGHFADGDVRVGGAGFAEFAE